MQPGWILTTQTSPLLPHPTKRCHPGHVGTTSSHTYSSMSMGQESGTAAIRQGETRRHMVSVRGTASRHTGAQRNWHWGCSPMGMVWEKEALLMGTEGVTDGDPGASCWGRRSTSTHGWAQLGMCSPPPAPQPARGAPTKHIMVRFSPVPGAALSPGGCAEAPLG